MSPISAVLIGKFAPADVSEFSVLWICLFRDQNTIFHNVDVEGKSEFPSEECDVCFRPGRNGNPEMSPRSLKLSTASPVRHKISPFGSTKLEENDLTMKVVAYLLTFLAVANAFAPTSVSSRQSTAINALFDNVSIAPCGIMEKWEYPLDIRSHALHLEVRFN